MSSKSGQNKKKLNVYYNIGLRSVNETLYIHCY